GPLMRASTSRPQNGNAPMGSAGLMRSEGGDIPEGLQLVTGAIAMARLHARDGVSGADASLGSLLQIRGRIYGNNSRQPEAIVDLDESISIFQRLIVDDGQTALKPHLARSERHRKEAEMGKALSDID
ncbi:MAG: hypothetical protein WD894_24315, partial [Pirellulales bacterium]